MLLNCLKERFLKDIITLFPEIENQEKAEYKSILASVRIEEPKNREFGDLTTNAAMVLASKIRKKPSDLATLIKTRFLADMKR